MSESSDMFEDVSNPLDSVEDIMSANDWNFDRMNEDELRVDVTGRLGTYRMEFIWQEDASALQFCCHYDLSVHQDSADLAARMLSAINAGLWLGHFDMADETLSPRFRHTSLFRGMTGCSGAEHIEDLIDIALTECERLYPTFHLLAGGGCVGEDDLDLAMVDIAGQA